MLFEKRSSSGRKQSWLLFVGVISLNLHGLIPGLHSDINGREVEIKFEREELQSMEIVLRVCADCPPCCASCMGRLVRHQEAAGMEGELGGCGR